MLKGSKIVQYSPCNKSKINKTLSKTAEPERKNRFYNCPESERVRYRLH